MRRLRQADERLDPDSIASIWEWHKAREPSARKADFIAGANAAFSLMIRLGDSDNPDKPRAINKVFDELEEMAAQSKT